MLRIFASVSSIITDGLQRAGPRNRTILDKFWTWWIQADQKTPECDLRSCMKILIVMTLQVGLLIYELETAGDGSIIIDRKSGL